MFFLSSKIKGNLVAVQVGGFFGNFRNLSNFEELYLRAQSIFFDGTGTIVKIYL